MDKSFHVIGIGASAGGQQALQEFFSNVPATLQAAFVVIIHLHRDYVSQLDTILAKFTKRTVRRMEDGEIIEINKVYIIPENVTVEICNGMFKVKPRTPDHIINRTVDTFLLSLAKDFGKYAVAIILSGCGSDGAKGVKLIAENGGSVFVQDPESTLYNGMPIAAINADHPGSILSPSQLARCLEELLLKRDASRRKQGNRIS